MPTSFALFSLRAVLRFIKLMQASNNTNTPMMPKSQTNCTRPPMFFPSFHSEYKCHLLIGWRNTSLLNFFSSWSTLSCFACLIFSDTALKSTPGCTCTYIRKELLPQEFLALLTHSLLATHKSHEAIKRRSLKSVLYGKSS